MNFYKNLKAFRKRDKITQTQAAEDLGISVTSLKNYENGDNIPGIDKLYLLYERYGWTPNQMMGISVEEEFNNKPQVEAKDEALKAKDETIQLYQREVKRLENKIEELKNKA